MPLKHTLTSIFLFALICAQAQQEQPVNPSLDLWRGGYFERCCGLSLATPDLWGIVEQPMQMAVNHFVFKETDTVNIYSGNLSARLYTDTTALDSAGDTRNNIAVLVPGVIACAGMICYGNMGFVGDPALSNAYSQGLQFISNPLYFNFHMKINHLVPDTASYAYVFTRWNSVAMKEDTLAFSQRNIDDEDVTMNVWTAFTDTIHYLLPGPPDTLHIIFRGGMNGDPGKVGNTVWLDDISFSYPTSGLVHLDKDDALSIYPNPAYDLLHVNANGNMKGCAFEIFDVTGRMVKSSVFTNSFLDIPTSDMAAGSYYFRTTDSMHIILQSGDFAIAR